MSFLYRWLFLDKLSEETELHRIAALRTMRYFILVVSMLETALALLGQEYVFVAVAVPFILFFLFFHRYWLDRHHYTGNAILLYLQATILTLTFSLPLQATSIISFSVLPFLLVFTLGLRRGLTWLCFDFILLVSSLFAGYQQLGVLPISLDVLIGVFVTACYVLGLTIVDERTVRGLVTRLKDLSENDALTGVCNRRVIMRRLEQEVDRSRRYESPLFLLFLDIDHFKNINDTHGHHVGDRVLKAFAQQVEGCVRGVDTIGRFGGEEFIAILPETDEAGAKIAAERIRTRIESYDFAPADGCTVSIGAAAYRAGDTPDNLINRADAALYRAKEKGRNRLELAESPQGG